MVRRASLRNKAYLRSLGLVPYVQTLQEMQDFNQRRTEVTPDEVWMLEHPSVFTLGINAKETHVLNAGNIPIVRVDRGGQVTWHGPGQLVVYILIDIQRKKLGVRELVCRLERSIIKTLAHYDIAAAGKTGAPGVYTKDGAKIGSIGLRVKNRCCYHGLSLNVNNDLKVFERINPCGYDGLQVTRIADHGGPDNVTTVGEDLLPNLMQELDLSLATD